MKCGKKTSFGKSGRRGTTDTQIRGIARILLATFMNQLNGKNVLVTGGAGLVGSHLTEKLLGLGAKVFVLDIVVLPGSYFETRKLSDKARYINCDLANFEGVKKTISDNKIEYIFHLGAQAIVQEAFEKPLRTFESNITGTVNVLEAARQLGDILGIFVASSDKAYGKDCENALETQKVFGDHPYDASKAATDIIARTYFKTYGLPVSIARFGNIFGPGDLHFDRIIPGIMKAAIKDEVLEIRSNGEFSRDYLYVKDVAEGYVNMAENIQTTKGEAFNFSTNWNFSVLGLVAKSSQVLGKTIETKILNNQQNEIPFQSLNSEKSKKVLGWQPISTFEGAVKETFEWYNKNI
jgi:CDP-glucose 4,6-dehydratase